jgi:glycerol-3-phosphate O-acyltransferase / dihydroxyacetone phosphate acyltransferase
MWLRRWLVWFVRLVTRVFFRTIEVAGREHVPLTGPVVFIGNHPNSLLDPLMLLTTAPRALRFAAKEPLFHTPLLPVLRILGAVPVKRRQDQSTQRLAEGEVAADVPANVDNNAAFEALGSILNDGGAFAIFPEGISHAGTELTPLKTGAARLVLQAHAKGLSVVVVPVGLTYRRRHRMRSRVLVQYGEPLHINDALLSQLGEGANAKRLTSLFDAMLRGLTINAPDFELLRTLDVVRQLYRPPNVALSLREQATLMGRLLRAWDRLQHEPAVMRFRQDVDAYRQQLALIGAHDGQLRALHPFWSRALQLTRHLFTLSVLTPVALPGLLLHAPVVVAAILAGQNLVDRHDVRATLKMCVVTLLVLVSYAALGVVAAFAWGIPWACVAVALVSLSGLAALRFLEDQKAVIHGVQALRLLWDMEQALHNIAVTRDQLRGRLLQLVDMHFDPQEGPRIIEAQAHQELRWLDDDDDVA